MPPASADRVLLVARHIWGLRASLAGATQTTGPLVVSLGRRARIIAAVPSVARGSSGALPDPTLADLEVSLTRDQEQIVTRTIRGSAPVDDFVSLTALDIMGSVALEVDLEGELAAEIRWARDVTGGPWTEDAIVSLALYGDYV